MDPITTTTVTTYTLSNNIVGELTWGISIGDMFIAGLLILLLAAAGLDFCMRLVWRR